MSWREDVMEGGYREGRISWREIVEGECRGGRISWKKNVVEGGYRGGRREDSLWPG